MTSDDKEVISSAKSIYNEYLLSQKDFSIPQCSISIEKDSNEKTKVYIDVSFNETQFHFRSIEYSDVENIYQHLNSNILVRQKLTNGNLLSRENTIKQVETLVQRFENDNSPLYLYSGLILEDFQTETFLGLAKLGDGPSPGSCEMGYVNRLESWSDSNSLVNQKHYSGVATVEAFSLIQYAQRLKQDKYLCNGHELQSVVASARIDNPGSWKACAKGKMFLQDVGYCQQHGNQLRYQLKIFV